MHNDKYYTEDELIKISKGTGFTPDELRRYTKVELSKLIHITKRRIKRELRDIK
jgi:hypothetical protein